MARNILTVSKLAQFHKLFRNPGPFSLSSFISGVALSILSKIAAFMFHQQDRERKGENGSKVNTNIFQRMFAEADTCHFHLYSNDPTGQHIVPENESFL